ncbi:uncharacterized protein LOC111333176 [Stylophora pistillata]|uniref:uncharacterized protein LOC111333176 n=1 Tax=Stylophora pistillata TaxID=50429 RepID=UPI000C041B1A|nr:uncharacterized protein LOC111333176 [Stylophora pistillata]
MTTIIKLRALMCTFLGLLTFGQGTVSTASDSASVNYSVPLGGTWTINLNLTDADQWLDHVYLKRDGNRLIKLRKGEAGNGTCYNETPGCQTYYNLRNIGEGIIEVTICLLSKSVQGFYELYTYCTGTDHNCNRYGAIKTFWLITEDEQNPTEGTSENNITEEDFPFVKGCAMNIHGIWLGKLTSLSIVPLLWWFI